MQRKVLTFLRRRRNWTIPYVLFLAFFVLVPMALIVFYAFTNAEGSFTFANIQKFWIHPEAMNTFLYSVVVALITTFLCILICYPAAYILSKMEARRAKLLVILFILPMWINFLIRTLATVALFDFFKIPLGEGALIFGMVYNFLRNGRVHIYTVIWKDKLVEKLMLNTALILKKSKKFCLPIRMFVCSRKGMSKAKISTRRMDKPNLADT